MTSPASRPRRTLPVRRRRPLVVESMERRDLMAAKVVHDAVAAKAPQPILVAAMGDSLTDEYTFENQDTIAAQSLNRGAARNWVSTLMALRMGQMSFGQYSGVSRGGARQQGFAQDWALSGEPAVGTDVGGKNITFLNQYAGFPGTSIPGLLTQTPNASGDVDPKSIKVVTIYIGTNDYNLGLTAYAETHGQLNVFDAKPGMTNVANARVEDAITAVVGKIRTTIPKAKIVVVTPQVVTSTPLLISKYGSVPGLFAKVDDSLTTLNADMARITKQQKLGFVNLQAMAQQMGPAPSVAGQAINPQGNGPDLEDTYVDGFHFGTLMQGKIAQAVVKQIDALYGKNVVTPVSDSDILNYARATLSSITLAKTPSPAGPARTTLAATVTSGVGNASVPTGTVTFEAITPASAATPTATETVLGTLPVDATGHISLDVDSGLLNSATFYATYSGDELHTSRASAGLSPFAITT